MVFETYRKFRTCIFCGGTGELTKEHIFGKALATAIPCAHNWATSGPLADGVHCEVKGSSPILNITSPVACRRCNNELLSADMQRAQPLLQKLVAGGLRCLMPEHVVILQRYWERVALIVDVVTSNYDLTEKAKLSKEHRVSQPYRFRGPVVDAATRASWLRGKAVPNVGIYVGMHSGVLGLNPYTAVAHKVGSPGIAPGEVGAITLCKTFSIVIGHFAVSLRIGAEIEPRPRSFVRLGDRPCIGGLRLGEIGYQDFLGTLNWDRERAALELLMSNRAKRRLIEERSRKAGTLAVLPEEWIWAFAASSQSGGWREARGAD